MSFFCFISSAFFPFIILSNTQKGIHMLIQYIWHTQGPRIKQLRVLHELGFLNDILERDDIFVKKYPMLVCTHWQTISHTYRRT